MSKKITYKVVGEKTIHCNGCENTINLALNELSGVSEASADREKQLIKFTLSGELDDSEKVISKLDMLGYAVESV